MSQRLYQALKDYNPEVVHGSRDYYNIYYKDTVFEFIPVLDLDYFKPENVTDMSPLHVDYFNSKALKEQKDDVRLLKVFCQSSNIYGAESYINGFSGHVLCLLVLYYGSFMQVLKNASKWKPKVVIDLQNHHKFPLMAIDKSKTLGPLVIVDPVQKQRNAAAGVSNLSFNKFISKSKKFLKEPSKKFFEKEDLTKLALKQNGLVLKADYKAFFKRDVAGAKALKVKKFLKSQLQKYYELGFVEFEFKNKKGSAYFEIKKIPKYLVLKGPPTDMKDHATIFKTKHKNVKEKEGKLYAKIKNPNPNPEKFFKQLLNKTYVKEKVEEISVTYLNK
jgi:tRNA nucleotidyltransferase (CCA-adding enzyme)